LQRVGAAGGGDGGRAVINVPGAIVSGASPPGPSDVRFRVVATAPATTQITIAGQAVDAGGAPAALQLPGPLTLRLNARP
jgi:hypothetical protein